VVQEVHTALKVLPVSGGTAGNQVLVGFAIHIRMTHVRHELVCALQIQPLTYCCCCCPPCAQYV
jgi:hypothetical protein